MLYARSNVIRCLDEQFGIDFRWYTFSLINHPQSIDKLIAIHMAFDCMAIGVGLFASVMATWDPNERFTYGYLLKIFFAAECTFTDCLFSAMDALRHYLDLLTEFS